MAEQELQQPSQEVGALQQQQEGTTLRALQFQINEQIKRASEYQTELGRMQQEGQFEPNRLLPRVIELHHSAGEMVLDVGACVEQQNSYRPQQRAPDIRRGAPVQRNPSAAHTNQTAATDNGGALPLQDQALGALGVNGDFISIHQGIGRISPAGAMANLAPTMGLAPIAGTSARSRTPAPEDNVVTAKPPAVQPTPPPESNTPSKPSPPPMPAVHSHLRRDYTPREGQEAEAQAHDEQHDTQPQSWPPTSRARTGPSARRQLFTPPGTIIPSSGPRAMIHLEGEHFPRLQAEEPD